MRNNMVISFLLACSLGVITTGCSTVDKMVNGEEAMIEVPASSLEELEVPAWFLTKEEGNTKVLTVTATETSKDLQFAIDKAELNAKVKLAQKLGTTVSSLVRESALESGVGVKDVETEVDRISQASTNQLIGFYRRENMKVVREGEYYRAYIMLRLDTEEGRRLTQKPRNNLDREEKFKQLQPQAEVNIITPIDARAAVETITSQINQ